MRKHYYFAKTLAVLYLLIMTFTTMFYGAPKIIVTAHEMLVLHEKIQMYNDATIKTDEMTEENIRNCEKRKEYYNSPDSLIHWFANLDRWLKVLVAIAAVASYPMFVYMWLVLILEELARKIRRQNHKRRNPKVS